MSTVRPHKKTLAVITVNLLLIAPLLLKVIPLPNFRLAGSSQSTNVPHISSAQWFEGSFQEACNEYAKNNFGAHDWYVRSYNQLDFWLFNKANARYVVVGKNNCLFESGYLDAYRGKDFVGEEKLKTQVIKMKELQRTMKSAGKLFLPIIAPSKASYYPEYIPKNYEYKLGPDNYSVFTKLLLDNNVQHIDFSKWIVANKSASKYPLYPLSGIHWSNYAALLAFDSIARLTEHGLTCKLPQLSIKSIHMSQQLQYPDNDIAEGLNLLFPLKQKALAYADYVVRDLDSAKLNVITIADSFWWYIYSQALPQRTFKQHNFWYYNELIYPQSESTEKRVINSNYFEMLRKADVVIVLYSESNLHRYSDGAIDACYEAYCKPNAFKEQVQKMKETICADISWYNSVVEKAVAKRLTVDSMLTLDAIYMVKQAQKKGP